MRPRFLVVLAVAVTAAVPSMAAAAPYRVKDLRQVSGPSPFAAGCPGAAFDATMITGQEVEPSITVNPANPRNIVGTWKQDVGPDSTRSDLVASSQDGGRTWRRSTIPGLSKCTGGTADGASDPWVSAGVDGTVYFTGLAPHFQGNTPLSAVVASRSRDGGRTWRVPATLSPPAEGNETPAITASPRRPGRAYAVWAEFATAAIKFSRTNDRGATWSPACRRRPVDPGRDRPCAPARGPAQRDAGDRLRARRVRDRRRQNLRHALARPGSDMDGARRAPRRADRGVRRSRHGRGTTAAAVRKRRGRARRVRVRHRRGQQLGELRRDRRGAVARRRSRAGHASPRRASAPTRSSRRSPSTPTARSGSPGTTSATTGQATPP